MASGKRWTCDQQQVAGSTPGSRTYGCSLGQTVHTHVSLSPSSINLVPAQAGKVTVGLASHWPCVTDSSGITTYTSGNWLRTLITRYSMVLMVSWFTSYQTGHTLCVRSSASSSKSSEVLYGVPQDSVLGCSADSAPRMPHWSSPSLTSVVQRCLVCLEHCCRDYSLC